MALILPCRNTDLTRLSSEVLKEMESLYGSQTLGLSIKPGSSTSDWLCLLLFSAVISWIWEILIEKNCRAFLRWFPGRLIVNFNLKLVIGRSSFLNIKKSTLKQSTLVRGPASCQGLFQLGSVKYLFHHLIRNCTIWVLTHVDRAMCFTAARPCLWGSSWSRLK